MYHRHRSLSASRHPSRVTAADPRGTMHQHASTSRRSARNATRRATLPEHTAPRRPMDPNARYVGAETTRRRLANRRARHAKSVKLWGTWHTCARTRMFRGHRRGSSPKKRSSQTLPRIRPMGVWRYGNAWRNTARGDTRALDGSTPTGAVPTVAVRSLQAQPRHRRHKLHREHRPKPWPHQWRKNQR